MWAMIKENLENLDNVTEIWRHLDIFIGISFIGTEPKSYFNFETTELRDQEFSRLIRLLLK